MLTDHDEQHKKAVDALLKLLNQLRRDRIVGKASLELDVYQGGVRDIEYQIKGKLTG